MSPIVIASEFDRLNDGQSTRPDDPPRLDPARTGSPRPIHARPVAGPMAAPSVVPPPVDVTTHAGPETSAGDCENRHTSSPRTATEVARRAVRLASSSAHIEGRNGGVKKSTTKNSGSSGGSARRG
jgi:hypothetical protein